MAGWPYLLDLEYVWRWSWNTSTVKSRHFIWTRFFFFLKTVDFKLFILPGEKFNLSITFYCMITLRSHFKNAVAAMAWDHFWDKPDMSYCFMVTIEFSLDRSSMTSLPDSGQKRSQNDITPVPVSHRPTSCQTLSDIPNVSLIRLKRMIIQRTPRELS